jgi:drug/metabolite transporter (DMT)-like permease
MGEQQGSGFETAQQPVLSAAETQLALQALRSEQNLVMGALAGLAAALVGAAIWAIITALTQYQIGFMAIGIGFLVGFAVRAAGKGIDPVFGVVGAALALLGCVLGNLVMVLYFLANKEQMPLLELLSRLDLKLVQRVMTATFDVMDMVFYGIAMYCGYKYAFRQVTKDQLAVLGRKPI